MYDMGTEDYGQLYVMACNKFYMKNNILNTSHIELCAKAYIINNIVLCRLALKNNYYVELKYNNLNANNEASYYNIVTIWSDNVLTNTGVYHVDFNTLYSTIGKDLVRQTETIVLTENYNVRRITS